MSFYFVFLMFRWYAYKVRVRRVCYLFAAGILNVFKVVEILNVLKVVEILNMN